MHVGDVQSGGRLVEHIHGAACAALRKLRCELDALRLAAGERRARLAELDVAKPDVAQSLYLVQYLRLIFKEGAGFVDGHVENIGDVLALEAHLKSLAVIALAVADLAGDVDIRQEVHLYLQQAVAAAGLAAAALDVEGEAPLAVATELCVLRRGEKLAYVAENTGVGRGI